MNALLYVILGAAGSGRRTILHDLLQAEKESTGSERNVVLLSPREFAEQASEPLKHDEATVTGTWTMRNGQPGLLPREPLPVSAERVFLLTDGLADPADQIEAIREWIPGSGTELGRIITVVNCHLAYAAPEAMQWYEGCIHFSDIALLNRREGVPNKWVDDWGKRFRKRAVPTLFELVKKGHVPNPAHVLFPEPRRLTHIFDGLDEGLPAINDGEDWLGALAEEGTEIILEREDGSPLEEGADADDTAAVLQNAPEHDPYLRRKPGGFREIPLPAIGELLGRVFPEGRLQ